jgi:Uma2 family endonuclease
MATIQQAAEQRIVLRNVSWETYERLLADHLDSSAPRFSYDRGELEIMSPLPEHEELNRLIASLVEMVAVELGIEIRSLGSTTFRREELGRGFEADSCFYVQSESMVRGKRQLDLRFDPPPDLVIEIDITRSSLNKLGLFAALGVPEVWRFDGEQLSVLVLGANGYEPRDRSDALPAVTLEEANSLIEAGKDSTRIAWLRKAREWARSLAG